MGSLTPAARCQQILAKNSRSFALASKLLPAAFRDDVAVTYAFCRRCDDAVDDCSGPAQVQALARLRAEISALFAGRSSDDPVLLGFQDVIRRRELPEVYISDLVDGMAMDVEGYRYCNLDDLFLYCHRAAGVVGLMMCHLIGATNRKALPHAAHLGMAMQLTNICRDVVEDAERGRYYLPGVTALSAEVSAAVEDLLCRADRYYASAKRGLRYLPWRVAFAIRAAGYIYSAIGSELRRRNCDVFQGRAVVPTHRKLLWVGWSLIEAIAELPGRAIRGRFKRVSDKQHGCLPIARYPNDIPAC